jgi:protein-disulfide isomerase
MNIFTRASVLSLMLAASCVAQTLSRQEVDKRIEHQVRSYAGAKATARITLGDRKPSDLAGYDLLPVTIDQDGTTKTFGFHISKDGKTLLYVNRFDLSEDPWKRAMHGIDLTGRPARGAADAKVTIVVYDDFQCPFCAKFYIALFNEVMNHYRDSVRVVFKDFPLADVHPWATHAAVDANCLAAKSTDAYWAFADHIHTHQQRFNEAYKTSPNDAFAALDQLAIQQSARSQLDSAALSQCIAQQKTDAISASVAEGTRLGVSATPGIFVNGEQLEGALTADEIRATIEQALADAKGDKR